MTSELSGVRSGAPFVFPPAECPQNRLGAGPDDELQSESVVYRTLISQAEHAEHRLDAKRALVGGVTAVLRRARIERPNIEAFFEMFRSRWAVWVRC